MFTITEFRLIQKNCPEKLDALLNNLGITKPDLNSDDEFKIFAALDEEIISSLCKKMESESILEGYTKLMTIGGLKFNYSETENELLATILQNKDKIQNCLQNKNIEIEKNESPPKVDEEIFDYNNVNIVFSRADFDLNVPMTSRKNFVLGNRTVLNVPQDLAMNIKNLIGEYFKKAEPFNIVEAIEVSVKTVNATPEDYYKKKRSIHSKNKPTPTAPPFNQDELSEVMESLKLVEDIVKSMD